MKKIKVGHPGRNLGKYLVKAKPKLPDNKKIGATKLKLTNQKNKLGSTTVVKPTKKRMRKQVTPKGI